MRKTRKTALSALGDLPDAGSLAGIKKYATAFILGVMMAATMPPLEVSLVLLLCVPGFIGLARQSRTKREAFLTGWAFGAGYFIAGLYWISYALFVDIAQFWWVLPFSAVLGPAALGLYYGFVPLLAWRYRKHERAHALMFVAAFALIEWIRGHAFTGFPWNLPGYTWQYFLSLMQVNSAIGIYGLTLLTLLWAAAPLMGKRGAVALLALFLMLAGAGALRLHLLPTEPSGHTVRIVQPNIPETLKWSRDDMRRNFEHILKLTATPAQMPITFTVWPETAVPSDLQRNPAVAQEIAASLPSGSMAVIGTLRSTAEEQYFNSVTAMDGEGHVLGNYDKHHLVPFGEYIPYRQYLNLTPIANGIAMIGDFTRGGGVTTMRVGGNLPAPSPLVCYEAIFPGAVARDDDRPGWLVNVTNDAWYGYTAGPYQHLENARVRAIEEGLPLVRAANTGVSAVVDPLGRYVDHISLGSMGIVDAILPAPLPPTVYAQFGDTLFFLMLVLLGILGETVARTRR
jgi:apolipoprotein N-acyltransferase